MQEFLYTLGSTVIVGILVVLWRSLEKRLTLKYYRYYQRIPSVFRYVTVFLWIVAGSVVYLQFQIQWVINVYFLFTIMLLIYFLFDRSKFDGVGLVDVDKEIRKGINYSKSLTMCKNTLKFLGTGAYKLTSSEEFERAIKRCKPDEPIQMLLCKPTDAALQEGAVRYGVEKDDYKNKVIESLRKLSNLKNKYQNIDVRFYSHYQMFRLMFIDNSITL